MPKWAAREPSEPKSKPNLNAGEVNRDVLLLPGGACTVTCTAGAVHSSDFRKPIRPRSQAGLTTDRLAWRALGAWRAERASGRARALARVAWFSLFSTAVRGLTMVLAVVALLVACTTTHALRSEPVTVRRLVELASRPAVTADAARVTSDGRPLSTELNSSYVDESVVLDASSTALVMVDVWTVTDPMLLENMHKRLLPLLAAARQLGVLIVHAPSEAPLWDQLTVLPGELLVTGERGDSARCDLALKNASQTSHRNITHVLLVGYDTNLCVVDKPCGAVQLSTELLGDAEVLLIRDTTRPGADEYGNPYYTTETSINMIESGAWLPRGQQHIRSLMLHDLLVAFGRNAEASALPPLQLPAPQMSHRSPAARPFALTLEDVQSNTALLVVAAADNFDNDGYQARVNENMDLWLLPLLESARAAKLPIIHLPNGRHLSLTPARGEFVLNSTAQLAQVVRDFSLTKLLYCGYAANRELLWGDGGLAHFYAYTRYGYSPVFPAVADIPQVSWVPSASVPVAPSLCLCLCLCVSRSLSYTPMFIGRWPGYQRPRLAWRTL